jgi:integrase
MANLGKKNNVYLARFRLAGREYKRSLKTDKEKDAEAAMLRVSDALHRLAIGVIHVPEGVDPGDFVVSGGTLTAPVSKPDAPKVPTLSEAVCEYEDNLGHLAQSYRFTISGHLRTLKKKLGQKADAPINTIKQRDLEGFLQSRLKERSSTTVSKERVTLLQLFEWLAIRGYADSSPVAHLPKVKPAGDLSPFRTYQELETIVKRGGFSPRQVLALWDCLYLNPAEISELLATVRERSREDVSLILHSIPAYTGMRRGEIMRLSWQDIEFDQDAIVACSLKQSRQVVETRRRIDMHPELKAILLDWRAKRPKGQLVVCDQSTLAAFTSRQTTDRFTRPLRGTKWCLSSRRDWFKLGFHTYRHSFASNLAAAGVDQRVIDEWMGHQTEAMRRRYRHLFPKNRRSAIESFSFAAPAGSPNSSEAATA